MKFIPAGELPKFDQIWDLPEDSAYEAAKKQFISNYLPNYITLRKEELNKSSMAYESLVKFLEERIGRLKKYYGVDEKTALRIAFYELPSKVIGDYFKSNLSLQKNSIFDHARFIDLKLKATYRNINEATASMDLSGIGRQTDDDTESDGASGSELSKKSFQNDSSSRYQLFYDLDSSSNSKKRSKSIVETVKRGRGRPRKDVNSQSGKTADQTKRTKV